MITISVKNDLAQAKKLLRSIDSKQIPFAIQQAINKTAYQVKDELVAEMKRVFDRPTPYTLNAIRVKTTDKKTLEALVWLKDEFGTSKGTAATKYLYPQIAGGGRSVKRFEKWMQGRGILPNGMHVVPASGAELDQYGNIKRGTFTKVLSKLQANPDPMANETIASRKRASSRRAKQPKASYFVGRPGNGKLPLGIWARYGFGAGSAVKPVMFFVGQPKYRKRFHFMEVAAKTTKARFLINLKNATEYAMRTAK